MLESVATDRRAAYGSAVAGRLSSGRRGFAAGRTGAEESEDREVPVGTVRTDDLEEDGAEECLSDRADCADSGRGGGTAFAGASRAFFCAAIASFKAERPAREDVPFASPLREGPESFGALWCALGLAGSFSSNERDLGSRFERILFAISQRSTSCETEGCLLIGSVGPHTVIRPESTAHRLSHTRVGVGKAFLNAFLHHVQTSAVFNRTLMVTLLLDQGFEPTGRKKAKLDIFILTSSGDVLQNTRGESDIFDQSIDRGVTVLGTNLFHTAAEFDQILHHDFDHGVDPRTASLSNILDEKAADSRESRTK